MVQEPTASTEHLRGLGPRSLLNTANQGIDSTCGTQTIVSIHREIFFLILPECLEVFNNAMQQTVQKSGGTVKQHELN